MLTAVRPILDKTVRHYTGGNSPVALGKARSEAIRVLRNYDPKQSAPQTYLSNNLRGLERWQSARTNGVRIPSRASQHSVQLERLSQELEDKLGRPPSSAELAAKSDFSIEAITNLRRFGRPTAGSSMTGEMDGDSPLVAEDQMLRPQDDKAWLEMVYEDLNDKDRIVMEHTLGMFGQQKLSTSALAKRLKISQGAVSQRRKRVQAYVDRAMEVNPF